MAPKHSWLQADDEFNNYVIRAAVVWAGYSGKERSWVSAYTHLVVNWIRCWGVHGTLEAASGCQEAKKYMAQVVTEAKTWVWWEFGEVMEKDFHSALKWFWQTVHSLGGALLTPPEDIVRQWKKFLEDFLNSAAKSSVVEADSVDKGALWECYESSWNPMK